MDHTPVPIVDLSDIVDTDKHVHFDVVHVNKIGNRLIGERIAREIVAEN